MVRFDYQFTILPTMNDDDLASPLRLVTLSRSLGCAECPARGTVALGFTPYSGQPSEGLTEELMAAGLTTAHVVEKDKDICAVALKP